MASPAFRCLRAAVTATVILLISFVTVSGQLPTTPSPRKSTTTEIDHFDRDHPVNITVYRYTPFNITAEWSLPDHENQTELENFVFHYYKSKYSEVPNIHKRVRLARNVTSYTIRNLKPGTKYSFQVMANYTQGHLPYSIIYTVTTQGYGEDSPCRCNSVGTKRGLQMPCDQLTGQCVCNDKHTLGQHCDRCQEGYLWTNFTGCQECDCDKDRSAGTCHVNRDTQTIRCNCLKNFGGHRCLFCAPNFYLEGKNCLPCQCNGNTKPHAIRMCHHQTGECMACAYNTTGPHCENCLDGYVGDAIGAKNCTNLEDLPVHQVSDAATLGEVFHRNLGVIVGTCSAVLALVLLIVGVIIYRHWWRWRRRPLQFWTVQLKEDHERVSFSSDHPSYQHVDGDGGLLPDVVRYYDQPGGGWTRPDMKVSTGNSGRSRPRTHAGGDSSNPYRSLEA